MVLLYMLCSGVIAVEGAGTRLCARGGTVSFGIRFALCKAVLSLAWVSVPAL